MRKKIISAISMLTLIFSIGSAAFAAGDTRFTDISTDAWYADAVAYMQENKLMDGVSGDVFSPNTPTNRIVLTTALYRAEDSPFTSGTAAFSDVESGTEYSNAVT